MQQSDSLSGRVFGVIADRFTARSADIGRFVATQYSFEEWLNWEAFSACSDVAGWSVTPKPTYSSCRDQESNDYGDLLVIGSAERRGVLVEIGLAHDGTGNKWRAKLDGDAQKLAQRFRSTLSPLQIIVLCSASRISDSDEWTRWLKGVNCWNRETTLQRAVILVPNGEMVIRGWAATHANDLNAEMID